MKFLERLLPRKKTTKNEYSMEAISERNERIIAETREIAKEIAPELISDFEFQDTPEGTYKLYSDAMWQEDALKRLFGDYLNKEAFRICIQDSRNIVTVDDVISAYKGLTERFREKKEEGYSV